MKKSFRVLTSSIVGLSMLALTACGGGGGGSSVGGGHYYTHSELAYEFVRRVNSELGYQGYDLELVKINTLQYDYIVVYDWYYGTYDAYYIGTYNPGENLENYLYYNDYRFYYGLIADWDNTYYDPYTGIRFEKAEATGKNLAKLKALKESLSVKDISQKLQATYGLSAEKSVDTARFAYKLQNSPEGTFSVADYDAFAKELTGSTITEFQNDFKAGNNASLADRINKAAETTGMGIEGVNNLINDMFIK